MPDERLGRCSLLAVRKSHPDLVAHPRGHAVEHYLALLHPRRRHGRDRGHLAQSGLPVRLDRLYVL